MKTMGMALVALCLAAASAGAGTKEPGVGDVAPVFTLPGSDGKTHRLADFKGRRRLSLPGSEGVHRWLNGRMRLAPCERREDPGVRRCLLRGEH